MLASKILCFVDKTRSSETQVSLLASTGAWQPRNYRFLIGDGVLLWGYTPGILVDLAIFMDDHAGVSTI